MDYSSEKLAKLAHVGELRGDTLCAGVRTFCTVYNALGYTFSGLFAVAGLTALYQSSDNLLGWTILGYGCIGALGTCMGGAFLKLGCDVADATIASSYYQRELLELQRRQGESKPSPSGNPSA